MASLIEAGTGHPGRAAGAAGRSWLGRLQRWAFYLPVIFMGVFFALPLALTAVWSVFERTQFWMEPGFTLFAYENFFTSARLWNFLSSMYHSLIAVLICLVLGFPIAVFVRRRIPQVAQHRVVLLFILPFMVSEIIRIFAGDEPRPPGSLSTESLFTPGAKVLPPSNSGDRPVSIGSTRR